MQREKFEDPNLTDVMLKADVENCKTVSIPIIECTFLLKCSPFLYFPLLSEDVCLFEMHSFTLFPPPFLISSFMLGTQTMQHWVE